MIKNFYVYAHDNTSVSLKYHCEDKYGGLDLLILLSFLVLRFGPLELIELISKVPIA